MQIDNIILNADSYKVSHFTFMEPGTTKTYSYIEARKGGKYDSILFFGLQYYIQEYLMKPITREMIEEADAFLTEHGEPFNRKGWEYILEKHNGFLPLEIKALPEGSVVLPGTVLVTVINTDPECAWLTSYVETPLLRAVWYPTTVATHSREVRKVITKFLELSGDPALISYKLVDFGARGVSSTESAMIGGAAHLINFMSTDNLLGIKFVRDYYGSTGLAGHSIPATEHAVTTSWGRDHEIDFFRNILKVHAGKMVSVVCDTYDLDAAIAMWASLQGEIVASGCTIVIRPDSGEPVEMVYHVVSLLGAYFGSAENDKGYKVLPDYIRVIQGDGITLETVGDILANLTGKGWSADNVTFGSGGWLLQQVNRDTLRFAMKASWVEVNGQGRDIRKDPATDHSKASKAGKFDVVMIDGVLTTVPMKSDKHYGVRNYLETVYCCGDDAITGRRQTFDEIKKLAE